MTAWFLDLFYRLAFRKDAFSETGSTSVHGSKSSVHLLDKPWTWYGVCICCMSCDVSWLAIDSAHRLLVMPSPWHILCSMCYRHVLCHLLFCEPTTSGWLKTRMSLWS